MQLSHDTKRFFFSLSAFTVGLVLLVRHFDVVGRSLAVVVDSLLPFIVGACLAFLLSVPMHLFGKLLSKKTKKDKPFLSEKARRPVSLLLSILFVLLLLLIFSVIVLPRVAQTVTTLANSIMRFVPIAQNWCSELLHWLDGYPEVRDVIASYIPDLGQLASTFFALLREYAGAAISTVVSQASSFFGNVTHVIISIVFAIYVLLRKETLSRQCRKLLYAFLPKTFCDNTLRIATMVHKTFFSYVTIQCTEACILSSLCFAGMLIFRFPYAMVISVIMLFCALVPIYGAIISCVLGAFLVLIESPSQVIWFVLFILVLQQVENNLIYPRVVSTSINLPSMWVMLAVTAGGGLFGLVGMLTAVPVTSILYTLLGHIATKRLADRGLPTDDPMPPQSTAQSKHKTV